MSVGEVLAEARRWAGLSVAEVSETTRIRETIIRDIEQDNYAACGGDFYARGHIRAIARVVGTDSVPLIEEYDAVHRDRGQGHDGALDESTSSFEAVGHHAATPLTEIRVLGQEPAAAEASGHWAQEEPVADTGQWRWQDPAEPAEATGGWETGEAASSGEISEEWAPGEHGPGGSSSIWEPSESVPQGEAAEDWRSVEAASPGELAGDWRSAEAAPPGELAGDWRSAEAAPPGELAGDWRSAEAAPPGEPSEDWRSAEAAPTGEVAGDWRPAEAPPSGDASGSWWDEVSAPGATAEDWRSGEVAEAGAPSAAWEPGDVATAGGVPGGWAPGAAVPPGEAELGEAALGEVAGDWDPYEPVSAGADPGGWRWDEVAESGEIPGEWEPAAAPAAREAPAPHQFMALDDLMGPGQDTEVAAPHHPRPPRPPRPPRQPGRRARPAAAGGLHRRNRLALLVLVLLAIFGVAAYLVASGSGTPSRTAADTGASAHPKVTGGSPRPSAPATSPSAPASTPPSTPTAPPAAGLSPAQVLAFGPTGTAHGDNPSSAALALKGIAGKGWATDWYSTSHFGNLQAGTGLLLDMGHDVTITSAEITLASDPGADFQLRVGDTTTLSSLKTVASESNVSGVVHVPLSSPASARYVLLWFTGLPPDSTGTYQARVYDIKLQ